MSQRVDLLQYIASYTLRYVKFVFLPGKLNPIFTTP